MPLYRSFKTIFVCLTLIVTSFSIVAAGQEASNPGAKVMLELFHQPGCHACDMIKRLVLPRVDERFKNRYEIKLFDIAIKENFLRLADYQERLNIQDNESVTMIVQGKVVLSGYKAIDNGLEDAIDEALSSLTATQAVPVPAPHIQPHDDGILSKRAEKMTFAAVLIAGLIDCFNPCAFSTLVLFMSLLAVSKIGGRKLLAVGAVYCMSAFLTYTALGFGLFHCIKALSAFHKVQAGFNLSMAAILVVLATLSFRDAWKYYHGRHPEDISIQLPGRLKTLIHSAMKSGLKFHHLILGAAAVGVLVTLIESVCTGQVYIPTLTLLAKESAETFKWVSLILLYNVMFTIPLLLLFIAAYFGTGTPKLLEWSKRNVVPSKILMGLLFLALAAMIILL